MVNRLRRALQPRTDRGLTTAGLFSDQSADHKSTDSSPRDMDDDEIDGDVFQSSDEPDDLDDAESGTNIPEDSDGSVSTLKALVLPLYSLLSTEDQARIFAPVPEGYRLIVVATNIAETSITIPNVSYVVDPGRQKCRNYHPETGVASYDIMWISRASADQRAGRAGRTSSGHAYRLFSSSVYSRHMDAFAPPEVLTRPLEDVVLAMKSMRVASVADFPFPTPPDRSQVNAAVRLLANLGCLDLSRVEEVGGDGEITRLGMAVSKLPLGVRYSKILLVAAEAGVLDYALPIVAALSESNPFLVGGQSKLDEDVVEAQEDDLDIGNGKPERKEKPIRWSHKSGDLLAVMLAVGAYTFAGCDRRFCEENGLHPVVMGRIQKMRGHLARLSKARLGQAESVATSTGGFLKSMRPPNKLQEMLLCQSIASGFLDNIAVLAPLGSIPGQHPFSLRSAYLSCSSTVKEPLFMDRNSVVFSRDARQLPKWICFESLLRKTHKDGTSIAVMKNITPIDPSWLGRLADGSQLLTLGEPLLSPQPSYDRNRDAILCSVKTTFGSLGWEIPSARKVMYDALHDSKAKQTSTFMLDDSFRWFGRFLFEGEVLLELKGMTAMLNDEPSVITRKAPVAKVALLVAALAGAGVDSAAALRKHWAEVDDKFLFSILKRWAKDDQGKDLKGLWISCVKNNIRIWENGTK
jgi:ATP-dependent RNA helicase DHX37/DHR1